MVENLPCHKTRLRHRVALQRRTTRMSGGARKPRAGLIHGLVGSTSFDFTSEPRCGAWPGTALRVSRSAFTMQGCA